MEKEINVVITHYGNVTKEGVVLHLNIPATLKTGKLASKEFYVSWDKIGQSLFDNYAELSTVDEYRELRDKPDSVPEDEKKLLNFFDNEKGDVTVESRGQILGYIKSDYPANLYNALVSELKSKSDPSKEEQVMYPADKDIENASCDYLDDKHYDGMIPAMKQKIRLAYQQGAKDVISNNIYIAPLAKKGGKE